MNWQNLRLGQKTSYSRSEDRIKRLRQRETESKAQILKRIGLDRVLFVNHGDMFDYVIISGDGNENGVAQRLSEIIKK